MHKLFNHLRLFTFIAILALIVRAEPVFGQSDRDLRVENQSLKTQLKQQQRELDAALARIEKLAKQVQDLEKALDASRKAPKKPSRPKNKPLVKEKVSIDESVASASPRALLSALKASYEEAVVDLDQGQPGDKNHKAYVKAVQRWVTKANREYRTKVEWHVRVLGANPTKKGFAVELQAVDPKTNSKLGDPFLALLSKSLARRYEHLTDRTQPDVVVLRGTLHPNVSLNRTRTVAGPFSKSKFIGPFAQFNFEVDAMSLEPPNKKENRDISDS